MTERELIIDELKRRYEFHSDDPDFIELYPTFEHYLEWIEDSEAVQKQDDYYRRLYEGGKI